MNQNAMNGKGVSPHFLHSSFLAADRRFETWPMDLILIPSWSHFNCRLNLLELARSSARLFSWGRRAARTSYGVRRQAQRGFALAHPHEPPSASDRGTSYPGTARRTGPTPTGLRQAPVRVEEKGVDATPLGLGFFRWAYPG